MTTKARRPSALQTCRRELEKIQQAQAQCVNRFGIVKSECWYRYQILTRDAKSYMDAIQTLKRYGVTNEG